LTIYGLSPTRQQAHKELLKDLQYVVMVLQPHNSKLTKNSWGISNNI